MGGTINEPDMLYGQGMQWEELLMNLTCCMDKECNGRNY